MGLCGLQEVHVDKEKHMTVYYNNVYKCVCVYVCVCVVCTYLDKIEECLYFLNFQDAIQGWCAAPLNHRLPKHLEERER